VRSTASFKGHPIHPMLIPFPTAFVVGALLFDGASWLTGEAAFADTAGHLAIAGVGTGFLAAVPGVIDYLRTVPPQSSAKVRATRHALTNISALVAVLAAWMTRGAPGSIPSGLVLTLELAGAALISAGGYMGGVLVMRNQIGVDHRYAAAGKWNESRVSASAGTVVVVAASDELAVDQMKLVHAGSKRVVLARDGRGHVAFDDRCSHRGGSLAGGTMICGTVQCPWHGSQFDVRSGEVKAGPAKRAINTFEAVVDHGKVRLTL